MRLDKRKFTLGYMALLIVFIIVGIFMVLFSSNNETPEIDESLVKDYRKDVSMVLSFINSLVKE